jgi:tRNA(Phe) wybutosine-synthesizing methylase Tyw3
VLHFFAVFFGGLAVGIGFGWLLTKTIPLVGNQPLAHVTLTLVTAYGAFIAAEHFLHASGIMAVLAAGLMVGYRTPILYSRKVREYLKMFWEREALARVKHHILEVTVDEGILTVAKNTCSMKLKDTEARAQTLRSRLAESRKKRCRVLWLQTFAVQRKVYHARHDQGLLCLKSLNALE